MSKSVPRVELGLVRVNPGDATTVQEAIVRLTEWLRAEDPRSDNSYRPQRMGSVLTNGHFLQWSVRYAIVRSKSNHNGWPPRVLRPDSRGEILTNRSMKLGVCRVREDEAERFRGACLAFIATYCQGGEVLNQSKFLTLSAVGFADCVLQNPKLHNLPVPPWSVMLFDQV
jgi:hypothetical protein